MKHFFITGLPRSRTAWLANLLTTDTSLCYHELEKQCAPGWFGEAAEFDGLQAVGNSSSAMLLDWRKWANNFPDSKWVVVVRDTDEVRESLRSAIGDEIDIQAMDNALQDIWDNGPRERVYKVAYEWLDGYFECNAIYWHCLGRELPYARWELLNQLRITQHTDKALAASTPAVRAAVEPLLQV